jgi:hypothetical protein
MTLCVQLRQLVYQLVHWQFESFGRSSFAAVGGMAYLGGDGGGGGGGCGGGGGAKDVDV